MMPGNVAIRTVRVEKVFADDDYVKQGHSRDRVSVLPNSMAI